MSNTLLILIIIVLIYYMFLSGNSELYDNVSKSLNNIFKIFNSGADVAAKGGSEVSGALSFGLSGELYIKIH